MVLDIVNIIKRAQFLKYFLDAFAVAISSSIVASIEVTLTIKNFIMLIRN